MGRCSWWAHPREALAWGRRCRCCCAVSATVLVARSSGGEVLVHDAETHEHVQGEVYFVDVLHDIRDCRCMEAFSGRRECADSCICYALHVDSGVVGCSMIHPGPASARDCYPFLAEEAGRDDCDLSSRVGYCVLDLGVAKDRRTSRRGWLAWPVACPHSLALVRATLADDILTSLVGEWLERCIIYSRY